MIPIGVLLTEIISLAPGLSNLTEMLNDLIHLVAKLPVHVRHHPTHAYLMGQLRSSMGPGVHTKDLLSIVERVLPLILAVVQELLSHGQQPAPATVPPAASETSSVPAVRPEDSPSAA